MAWGDRGTVPGVGDRFRGANGKKVDRNTWAAGDEENRAGGGAVGTGSCGAGGYGSLPRGVYNIPIYTHTHIYIYIYIYKIWLIGAMIEAS
jgi:hypothetical protein